MKPDSTNIIALLVIIVMVLTSMITAQEIKDVYSVPVEQDSIDSWLGGLYGNYPILDREEIEENNIRLIMLAREVDSLISIRKILKSELDELLERDTVRIKDHVTFFGGLFTIPSLNAEEWKIKKLHGIINEHQLAIRKVDELLNDLEKERKHIGRLFEKNKKYRMVKLLWGFANWEVEKN